MIPPTAALRKASVDEKVMQARAAVYPAHVVGPCPAANGAIVHVRPIAAADANRIADFVGSLSSETRYLRFMAAVKELSAETIERFTRIDHRRDAALVALANNRGADRVVGVARYALDVDGEACEFAIVVSDDWRRRGLGRCLLERLIDIASTRGVKRIVGEVLAVNGPMLDFVKELGFDVAPSAEDPTIRRVERRLDGDLHAA